MGVVQALLVFDILYKKIVRICYGTEDMVEVEVPHKRPNELKCSTLSKRLKIFRKEVQTATR